MGKLLRVVLAVDAVVLFALGLPLMLLPGFMLESFGYTAVPVSVHFIVSVWGAVLLSIGYAYALAARERPLSILWVRFGLLRNLLQAMVALKFYLGGVIVLQQSWPALFIPVWFALFYSIFMLLEARERRAGEETVHVG